MAHEPALPPPPPLVDLLAGPRPAALFLDFDGTLVELAAAPDAICVPAQLPGALETLAVRLEGRLALVSGRALEDLDRHLGERAIAAAGSHGASLRGADGRSLGREAAALPPWARAELEDTAVRLALRYEAKPHGGALHWRENPGAETLALAAITTLAKRHGLAVKHGKAVAELVGPGADKGAAVRAFCALDPFAGSLPVFVGDDLTDEDGMIAAREMGGFGVAVGERASRAAQFALGDVAAVHKWLFP